MNPELQAALLAYQKAPLLAKPFLTPLVRLLVKMNERLEKLENGK